MGKGDEVGDKRTDSDNQHVDNRIVALRLQANQNARETSHNNKTIIELSHTNLVMIAC